MEHLLHQPLPMIHFLLIHKGLLHGLISIILAYKLLLFQRHLLHRHASLVCSEPYRVVTVMAAIESCFLPLHLKLISHTS